MIPIWNSEFFSLSHTHVIVDHYFLYHIQLNMWVKGKACFGRKICVWGAKIVLTWGKKTFTLFQAAKFVSATNVSRTAKPENICLHNSFPSLARP